MVLVSHLTKYAYDARSPVDLQNGHLHQEPQLDQAAPTAWTVEPGKGHDRPATFVPHTQQSSRTSIQSNKGLLDKYRDVHRYAIFGRLLHLDSWVEGILSKKKSAHNVQGSA